MRLRTVSPSEWAQLQAAEPYLRWGIDPGDPPAAWRPDDPDDPDDRYGLIALSRRRRSGGTRSLSFIRLGAGAGSGAGAASGAGPDAGSGAGAASGAGPDADVAAQLASMAAELIPVVEAGGLTVPRALAVPVHTALSALLPGDDPGGAPEGIGWDWMWIDHPLPPAVTERAAAAVRPGVLQAVILDVTDPPVASEVQTLLDDASPRHSAEPGDPRVRRWFGVRAVSPPSSEPPLVACAAWYESVPGVPLLASVAVRADHRGAGLGVALMATVSEAAFAAGCPAVTVDLYADNPVARNLYRSLGFRLEQEFASWWLSGQRMSTRPADHAAG